MNLIYDKNTRVPKKIIIEEWKRSVSDWLITFHHIAKTKTKTKTKKQKQLQIVLNFRLNTELLLATLPWIKNWNVNWYKLVKRFETKNTLKTRRCFGFRPVHSSYSVLLSSSRKKQTKYDFPIRFKIEKNNKNKSKNKKKESELEAKRIIVLGTFEIYWKARWIKFAQFFTIREQCQEILIPFTESYESSSRSSDQSYFLLSSVEPENKNSFIGNKDEKKWEKVRTNFEDSDPDSSFFKNSNSMANNTLGATLRPSSISYTNRPLPSEALGATRTKISRCLEATKQCVNEALNGLEQANSDLRGQLDRETKTNAALRNQLDQKSVQVPSPAQTQVSVGPTQRETDLQQQVNDLKNQLSACNQLGNDAQRQLQAAQDNLSSAQIQLRECQNSNEALRARQLDFSAVNQNLANLSQSISDLKAASSMNNNNGNGSIRQSIRSTGRGGGLGNNNNNNNANSNNSNNGKSLMNSFYNSLFNQSKEESTQQQQEQQQQQQKPSNKAMTKQQLNKSMKNRRTGGGAHVPNGFQLQRF
jgi:hypothetical protein